MAERVARRPVPRWSTHEPQSNDHYPEQSLDKSEILKLQAYLQRTFGNKSLKVLPHSSDGDRADVALGERRIATIMVDDEDGDRSFSFEMKIPVERHTIESYLRLLFDNDKFKVVPRVKKTDSVELNLGGEFLGVVSADNTRGESFTLQMAILDYDLEEI
jgi:hypothetical protein